MKLKSKSSALLATLFVAACGSSVIDLGKINDLGNGFAAMFASPQNSEPLDAQDVQIVGVSFTTDPFNP